MSRFLSYMPKSPTINPTIFKATGLAYCGLSPQRLPTNFNYRRVETSSKILSLAIQNDLTIALLAFNISMRFSTIVSLIFESLENNETLLCTSFAAS